MLQAADGLLGHGQVLDLAGVQVGGFTDREGLGWRYVVHRCGDSRLVLVVGQVEGELVLLGFHRRFLRWNQKAPARVAEIHVSAGAARAATRSIGKHRSQ